MTAVLDAPPAAICAPAFSSVPERSGSHVRAVEGVAAKLGRTLDPTQRFAVDVLTSAKADGTPATLAAAVLCPRQNLKTYVLELIALARLLRPGGDRLAVWSAHEVSTAQETFLKLVEYYEAEDERGQPLYPWFHERVRSVSRATGRESITFQRKLPSGRLETCRLKFKARIKTGGRGLAGDLVILDEAFALEPAHMGSLLPILSTKAKGQIIYGSSAPHASSAVLHDVVRRGRAGLMAYVEWRAPGSLAEPGCTEPGCAHQPGTPGCVLDDVELAVGCNPGAFHGRIGRAYLRQERQELTPQEYVRERYGWGEDPDSAGSGIPMHKWTECVNAESSIVSRPVLALDVSPDRSWASIAAGGYNADGVPHVELVARNPGTDWVVPELSRLSEEHYPERVGLDARGPAGALLPELEAAGVHIESLSLSDMTQACGGFFDAVMAGQVVHLGDPILSAALASAVKRDVGDAWAWGRRKSAGDISSLVAVTEAFWLNSVHGVRPGKFAGVFWL